MTIRKLEKRDIAAALALMRRHSEIENYADTFLLDEAALARMGFDQVTPAYHMLVKVGFAGEIEGYALYFLQQFTFRNSPLLYLNDLMVAEHHRRKKIASELVDAVRREAQALGCFRIKWSVSKDNASALRFYETLDARKEENRRYYYIDTVQPPVN